MDLASVGGILLALIGILGGLILEGGSIAQVTQPTAMLIVLGGTLGATMLQFPLDVFRAALRQFMRVFLARKTKSEAVVAQLVAFADKARRSGILSLDPDLDLVQDPFLKQALMLAIDGTEPSAVRKIMQLELENKAEFEERIPQVFESAGGFAPTVGIIGAVIGLIQVMQRLDNIAEVGRGIATAFVATIYGVGLANLMFLPVAGKLRIRHQEEQLIQEMMLEGVISLQEGMNPRMIEIKLRTFLSEGNRDGTAGRRDETKAAAR
jgi:chemotaxis protein MotA